MVRDVVRRFDSVRSWVRRTGNLGHVEEGGMVRAWNVMEQALTVMRMSRSDERRDLAMLTASLSYNFMRWQDAVPLRCFVRADGERDLYTKPLVVGGIEIKFNVVGGPIIIGSEVTDWVTSRPADVGARVVRLIDGPSAVADVFAFIEHHRRTLQEALEVGRLQCEKEMRRVPEWFRQPQCWVVKTDCWDLLVPRKPGKFGS